MTVCMSSTFLLPRVKVPSCRKRMLAMFIVLDNGVRAGLVWLLSCCLLVVGFRCRTALSVVVDIVVEWMSYPSRTCRNVGFYGHRSGRIASIIGKTGNTVEYFPPKKTKPTERATRHKPPNHSNHRIRKRTLFLASLRARLS